jgi:hypothetical protein
MFSANWQVKSVLKTMHEYQAIPVEKAADQRFFRVTNVL